MKPLKAATSFNSHKVKDLKRPNISENTIMTTSQNDHNKWNKRNLFLSVVNL